MFLFAFNLYKQINLFTKHIFANKDITIPYYIYSCFARSLPFCLSWCYASRGSCLPSFTILATIRGHPQPPPTGEAACRISPVGSFPLRASFWLSFIPGGILPHDHRQGAHTSLLSEAGSLALESKLQEWIDRWDYSNCQLFICSVGMAFASWYAI